MKFDSKYLGKWVAIKNEKVVASDKTLTKLRKKIPLKNEGKVRFTLIPKSLIAG